LFTYSVVPVTEDEPEEVAVMCGPRVNQRLRKVGENAETTTTGYTNDENVVSTCINDPI